MKERIKQHDRATALLRERFGPNLYGGPNYRIIRSEGRKEYFGKELGWGPKYAEHHCWILEKWCPPEQYGSKRDWELADLGPFPSHGDYELMWAFEKIEDDFSDFQLNAIAFAIDQNRNMTRTTRWARIKEREEKAKQEQKERLRAIVKDAAAVGDVVSAVPRNFAVSKIDIPKGSSTLKGSPNV